MNALKRGICVIEFLKREQATDGGKRPCKICKP